MIREATAADAESVATLWNHFILETLVTFNSARKTVDEVASTITARRMSGHGFLVAENQGRLDGFATYGQFRSGVGYSRTMEHTILLDEAARGRGLGRVLMTAIEDHAHRSGVHSIFAGVSSGNPAGRAFHLAMGYAEVAVLREVGLKWDRWLDLHLMQKIL